MKEEKEVEEMATFVESFKDSSFFNQEYVKGLHDALAFVLLDEKHFPGIELHKIRKLMRSRE